MKTARLGRTDMTVSRICLGSMTWGVQNTEAEGHQQIDRALDAGVNFIDTAEIYPTVPVSAETAGNTETIIGNWFANSGRRNDVILATKITGVGSDAVHKRPVTGETIRSAVEGSLARLQTDVIDLYQLHWPTRGSYHFRQIWSYDPSSQDTAKSVDHIAEVLEAMGALVAEGKVRAFGLSNETAWGAAQYLKVSERQDLPRIASIQNEYSLLCRLYDTDLAELSHHEDVGLLAYSPLAAGVLTGKYLDGERPAGSRGARISNLNGRLNERTDPPVRAYVDIARRHGLDPAQMALAWCLTRPFVASVIIGETTLEQLETNLAAAELTLSQDVLDEIEAVRRDYPAPM